MIILIVYVFVGLLIGNAVFIYSIWNKVPGVLGFTLQWLACVGLGLLWLPVCSYILYNSSWKI